MEEPEKIKQTPTKQSSSGRKRHRGLKAALWTVLALWAVVTVGLQVVLNTKVLTRIVNNLADDYVDGSVNFSEVSASMFKSFPNLNVEIKDFSLTYPHDRFAAYDSLTSLGRRVQDLGRCSEGSPAEDTLAHFCDLSVSINYMKLLTGHIRISKAELEHPRIFAKQFDSTAANWKMFKFQATEQVEDTTGAAQLPSFSIGKLSLTDRPLVVYSNPTDTLFGSIGFKQMTARGRYERRRNRIDKAAFDLDSMFVAGRLPADTLALALDHFGVKQKASRFDIDLKSKAFLALSSAGRMQIPFDLSAKFYPNLEKKVYEVKDLRANVAMLDIRAEGRADLSGENPYIKATAAIDNEPVREVTEYFGENFPILKKLKTDAKISLAADCDGYYVSATKSLPKITAHLEIPSSKIAWDDIDETGRFDLEANATSKDGRLYTEIPDFCFDIPGLGITLSGNGDDLLGDDPEFSVDGDLRASLDTLMRFVPDSLGIWAEGSLKGEIGGSTRLSQLSLYNFSDIGLTANIQSSGIRVHYPKDTINAYLGRTRLALGPYSHSESGAGDDDEHIHSEGAHSHKGITASIDSVYATVGASTFIRGRSFSLNAHNTDEKVGGDQNNHPIHAHLNIASLGMRDADSCFVGVRGSENVIKLKRQPQGRVIVPYLSFTSNNSGLAVREGVNRITAEGLTASISGHPVTLENQARRKHILDSLQRVYPGVPRDSLFKKAFARKAGDKLPDYLSEKDFAKKDINIQLGASMAEYIRNWDLAGTVKLDGASVITPYYPLENKVTGLRGRITNNEINLSELSVKSGSSDISASGTLSGLKRALTSGRGRMKLDMDINSDNIDVNEILAAMTAGKKFSDASMSAAAQSDAGDSEYLAAVQEQAAADTASGGGLIVLPSNLEAKVNLNANSIKFSDLETSWVSSNLEMKERCLQLTNTMAMTNMGDVYVEGFYSTRTKKDLKAGFDLTLSNITAEKVIHLFPAVDSIMPMLKAFKGLLDCEMAATASIDTAMNIVLPSISGIIKIDGKNLSLAESKELDKLRRTLMFRDRDSSAIDDMSVRGIIKDDHLEVFPFILKVDRYTIALNGLQKFDQNFKYHVSAIHSPIPFRFGVNLGGNFKDWKWRLGRAKYKSTNIPLFDEQVDGLRYNLLSAIHNIFTRGVDQALKQNAEAQAAIETKKTELAYNAEDDGEELSEEEKKQLEEASQEGEAVTGVSEE